MKLDDFKLARVKKAMMPRCHLLRCIFEKIEKYTIVVWSDASQLQVD
jgi:hypothetical protein